MSDEQSWIWHYLDGRGWVSPTDIGRAYGRLAGKVLHSAWASPKCKALVVLGMAERNDQGHYRRVRKVTA